jgi:type II secretory pathway pseudopilin PulG
MPDNLPPQPQGAVPPAQKKMPVWAWLLIGCGGLVVVGFVGSIVAAIALPSLMHARGAANETAAVANLRAYASAQAMYQRTNRTYADQLPKLAAGGLADPRLIAAYGSAGSPKNGYLFSEPKTIGGQAIDFKVDFALCAVPAKYGAGGRRAFIVGSSGLVYCKDLGPGGTFVDDFPADPATAGWLPAD